LRRAAKQSEFNPCGTWAREHFTGIIVNHIETTTPELKMKKLHVHLISLFTVTGIILSACAASASNSLIGDWKLVSYGSPSNPTPAAADVDTSIVFDADGNIGGSVGCNSFGGAYKVGGNTITFESIVSTLMMCVGPVGDQETVTLNVLVGSATFTRDGNNLTITSEDGGSVIVLTQK
jgi:heat shock protein HslJ